MVHRLGHLQHVLVILDRNRSEERRSGDAINTYFANKELGSAKTFRQVLYGKPFLVHCHKEDRYVTKIMSTHGLINEISTHKTYRRVSGE